MAVYSVVWEAIVAAQTLAVDRAKVAVASVCVMRGSIVVKTNYVAQIPPTHVVTLRGLSDVVRRRTVSAVMDVVVPPATRVATMEHVVPPTALFVAPTKIYA
jgi:hypothetical protein